jgi:small subunit ribosomal protein S4
MGDIRRLKKHYSKPSHPFEGSRILEELEYLGRFGLRNKKEFWRHKSQLGHYRKLAREARTLPAEKSKMFIEQIGSHLHRLGLIDENYSVDAILNLKVEDFLNRRLQTMVHKKGLAKTIYQARQLIIHGHIIVNGHMINTPSYIVSKEEEDKIGYYYASPFLANREKIWGSETEAPKIGEENKEKGSDDKGRDRRKDKKQKRKREE